MPTDLPTAPATEAPTEAPTLSSGDSGSPTEAPTHEPTPAPTNAPEEVGELEPTPAPGSAPVEGEAEAEKTAEVSDMEVVGGVTIRKANDGTYLVIPDDEAVESQGAISLAEASNLARDYLNTLEG